jgi:ATP-dependent Clp protease adapter protein ClpS
MCLPPQLIMIDVGDDDGWYNYYCLFVGHCGWTCDIGSPTTTTTSVIEKKREQRNARYVEDSRRGDHETWEVRLYNDGLNTGEHVSRSFVLVTGLSEYQAYQTIMRAHQNDMAVVGRYFHEIAEMFHDALKREYPWGMVVNIYIYIYLNLGCTRLDTQPLIIIVTMILKGEKLKKLWYGIHGSPVRHTIPPVPSRIKVVSAMNVHMEDVCG